MRGRLREKCKIYKALSSGMNKGSFKKKKRRRRQGLSYEQAIQRRNQGFPPINIIF